jgi:hypothetical protein
MYTSALGDLFVRDVNNARVVVQAIGTDQVTTVVQGVDGRYLPTGHLLYRSGGTMMAVRFDAERLAMIGSPITVADASVSSGAAPLATHLAVSASGTLVYVPGSGSKGQDLAVLNRRGQIERRLGFPEGAYATPRVSPDGRHVAYFDRTSAANIWVAPLDGSAPPRRLTFRGQNRFPVWSPDGRDIVYESDREGDLAIFSQRADGSSDATRLTKPERGMAHAPEAFSPDGAHLLVSVSSSTGRALWLWSRQSGSLQQVEESNANATFSPDGRWIAYTTRGPGGASVVRPFPLTPARYQVPVPEKSANMAVHPVWSPKTSELIYSAGPGLLASAPVTMRSAVEFGVPTVVQIPGSGDVLIRSWDITPDGQHIVRIIERDQEGAPTINVVLNWSEELKRRLPAQ